MDIKDSNLSRRNFLKHSALGMVGFGAGIGGFDGLQWAIGSDMQSAPAGKSKVVAIKSSGIVSSGKPGTEIVQRMMEEGMFSLTGKKRLQRHGERSLLRKIL